MQKFLSLNHTKSPPHLFEKQFNISNFHLVQCEHLPLILISLVTFVYVLISLVKLTELVFYTFFDY